MIVQSESDLRTVAEEASAEESKEIINQLIEELSKTHNGVGLSAPQIGINKSVFILQNASGFFTAFVNPVILSYNDPFIHIKEGCLSFPGLWINTIRYKSVVVVDDLSEGPKLLNNFGAIIAQHEIDHLNGVLFMDRKVPELYDPCFCGSGKKFKFCHYHEVR